MDTRFRKANVRADIKTSIVVIDDDGQTWGDISLTLPSQLANGSPLGVSEQLQF